MSQRSADIMGDDLCELRRLVEQQAADPGLWFIAEHVSEAYLQHALRELHDKIERATRWWSEAAE